MEQNRVSQSCPLDDSRKLPSHPSDWRGELQSTTPAARPRVSRYLDEDQTIARSDVTNSRKSFAATIYWQFAEGLLQTNRLSESGRKTQRLTNGACASPAGAGEVARSIIGRAPRGAALPAALQESPEPASGRLSGLITADLCGLQSGGQRVSSERNCENAFSARVQGERKEGSVFT